MSPFGSTQYIYSDKHSKECEIFKEEPNALVTGMRKLNVGDIGEICRLEVTVKPIAILEYLWWPQKA